MEQIRHRRLIYSVGLVDPGVRLFATFIILQTKMTTVTSDFLQAGQESSVQTGQSSTITEEEGGLEAADIAAIVLGVLLCILILLTVIGCILWKKGVLFRKEENKKVAPGGLLNGFSTTTGRVRDCSFRAITRDRSMPRTTSSYNSHRTPLSTDTESIIYMYDDVYHPPNSRPLPTNRVNAEPYEPAAERTISSKRSTPRYHNYSPRHQKRPRTNMKYNLVPKDHTNGAPTPPPTPEPETDEHGVSVISNGRINITTTGRSPYRDRPRFRY